MGNRAEPLLTFRRNEKEKAPVNRINYLPIDPMKGPSSRKTGYLRRSGNNGIHRIKTCDNHQSEIFAMEYTPKNSTYQHLFVFILSTDFPFLSNYSQSAMRGASASPYTHPIIHHGHDILRNFKQDPFSFIVNWESKQHTNPSRREKRS